MAPRVSPLAACALALALAPALASAQDGDPPGEDDDEAPSEDVSSDIEVDSPEIYLAFQRELKPLPADEQVEGWRNYLRKYPGTTYKGEIERRIAELKRKAEAAFDEEVEKDRAEKEKVDARSNELPFAEPFRFAPGNTRKRLHGSLFLSGVGDVTDKDGTEDGSPAITATPPGTLHYVAGLEWAIQRPFSVFGQIANQDIGFGLNLELGAKYALVKDVRTGVLLAAGGLFRFGFDRGGWSSPTLDLGADAFVHFGVMPPGTPVQIQAQVLGNFRFSPAEIRLKFGLNLGFRLSDQVTLFLESDGKMGFEGYFNRRTGTDETVIPVFFAASVGTQILLDSKGKAALTVGVSAPYLWRYWVDWFPVGGGIAFNYHL